MQSLKRFTQVIGSLALLGVFAVGGLLVLQSAGNSLVADTTPRETAVDETPPPPYPPPPDKTQPPRSTPEPTWDYSNPPTMPPATPKPITYSITSAEEWMIYKNPELGFSLRYPEAVPNIFDEPGTVIPWHRVTVFIRTGPTLPASYTNVAVIEIHVYPNPDRRSLIDVVEQLKDNYGGLVPASLDPNTDPILEYLLKAGADEVKAFSMPGSILYGAKSGNLVYLLGAGVMTESQAQSQVFTLLVGTLQFTD